MNPIDFFAAKADILASVQLSADDICYAAELSDIKADACKALPDGLCQADCTDTTEPAACDAVYFLKAYNGSAYVICDDLCCEAVNIEEIHKKLHYEPGRVRIQLIFKNCKIKSGIILLNAGKAESFCGSIPHMLKDFDTEGNRIFDNMPDIFVEVRFSKHTSSGSTPYELKTYLSLKTLISCNSSGIYLHNSKIGISFEQILIYHERSGYYCIVYEENNKLAFAEIYSVDAAKPPLPALNLIEHINDLSSADFEIVFPENIIRADSSLTLIRYKRLSLAVCDGSTYILKNYSLIKCSIRKIQDDLYITSADNTTVKYRGYGEAADMLAL